MIKQVASDVVSSLKDQPLLLMLLLLNLLGVAIVYFFVRDILQTQDERFGLIVKYCLEGKLPGVN